MQEHAIIISGTSDPFVMQSSVQILSYIETPVRWCPILLENKVCLLSLKQNPIKQFCSIARYASLLVRFIGPTTEVMYLQSLKSSSNYSAKFFVKLEFYFYPLVTGKPFIRYIKISLCSDVI